MSYDFSNKCFIIMTRHQLLNSGFISNIVKVVTCFLQPHGTFQFNVTLDFF